MPVEKVPDYPYGHVGHLTEHQEAALAAFRTLVHQSGYYHPAGENGRVRDSHDDETLLRYLRARKFNPEDAAKQFCATEVWRRDNDLEKVYESMDVETYELTRRLYPQWTGRRDKRGIPVYLFEIKDLTSHRIHAYEKAVARKEKSEAEKAAKEPSRLLCLFALYENLLRFVMPLCTANRARPHPDTPISMSNNIVDVTGVGLKQFWNLKSHMQAASELATAHYPETLDRIFIVGAPYYFSTVWGWINRWFDPITVSKIFILSEKDALPTLSEYIDIENIPAKYGGQLDFNFGDMPNIEPGLAGQIEWTADAPVSPKSSQPTLPEGPIRWHRGTGEYDGYMEAIAVGRSDGVPRRTVLARMRGDFGIMRGVSTVTGSTEALSAGPPQPTPTTTAPMPQPGAVPAVGPEQTIPLAAREYAAAGVDAVPEVGCPPGAVPGAAPVASTAPPAAIPTRIPDCLQTGLEEKLDQTTLNDAPSVSGRVA